MLELQVPEAFIPLWQNADYEHFAFYGGRGGTKSHSIAEATVAMSSQRNERVVCGRQFQSSIRDSVKELIERKIYKMNMAALFKSTDREIINLSTGSRYSFIGMDRNPDSAKSLEGCTFFWGEEAHMFTQRAVEIIIPTVRAPGSRMVWSWNPRFREDAVDSLFRGEHPPEKSYIREVSWRDNPFFYLTRMPSERRRMLRANPKRYKHVWEGGYDEDPDIAVFHNWSVGRPESLPLDARPRFGMDFGYSNDPYAVIKSYLLPDIDTIYIAQEAFGHKIPNGSLPALMDTITEIRDFFIIGDSSRPELIDYLQSAGFNIYGARKGKGSVKNGTNWLQGYHILVDPDCVNIQQELRMHRWKADPMGKPLPVPEDKFNHGIDALRYAHEEDSMSVEINDENDVVFI